MSRTHRTPKKDWADRFLAAVAATGVVSRAALLAGVGRRTVYDRRAADPAFAARWTDALEEGTERLEAEALRRAVRGTRRPVYQCGQRVGYIRGYSDTLLIFLLKARRPHVYRDAARVEQAGDRQAQVEVRADQVHRISLTPADLRAVDALLADLDARATPVGGGRVPLYTDTDTVRARSGASGRPEVIFEDGSDRFPRPSSP